MIRKAKQTELSSVMQIWLDGNIEGHPFIPTEYWQQNAERARQVMMTSEVYVYETEDHKVVGFIGLIGNIIGGLFVHVNYRKSGVGRELMDYVKSFKTYLIVNVYEKNLSAVDFYQQEGFRTVSEQLDNSTNETENKMVWEK